MDRLDELISISVESSLSEADAELTHLLRAEPSRRRELIDDYRMHQNLQALYRPPPVDAVENVLRRLQAENNPFVESVIRNISHSRRASKVPVGVSLLNWLRELRPEWVRGTTVAAGALILALITFGGWMLYPVSGRPEVGLIEGNLSLERGGRALAVSVGTRLQSGDELATGPKAAVILSFGREKTKFELGASTRLRIDQVGSNKRFALLQGVAEAQVARQGFFRPLMIFTPQAQVRVLGTRFLLAVNEHETTLDVREGKVRLTRSADGATAVVGSGMHALAGAGTKVAALPATGRILVEAWTNYPGTFLEMIGSDPDFGKRPNEQDYVKSFQSPVRTVPHLGERIRGYLQPTATGTYRFWVTVIGPGEAHLFLSRNEEPANRRPIAEYHNSPNAVPGPPPAEFPLVAGAQYYIEALHEGAGETQFTVWWEGPGRPREIIPGDFLSPAPTRPKKRPQR